MDWVCPHCQLVLAGAQRYYGCPRCGQSIKPPGFKGRFAWGRVVLLLLTGPFYAFVILGCLLLLLASPTLILPELAGKTGAIGLWVPRVRFFTLTGIWFQLFYLLELAAVLISFGWVFHRRRGQLRGFLRNRRAEDEDLAHYGPVFLATIFALKWLVVVPILIIVEGLGGGYASVPLNIVPWADETSTAMLLFGLLNASVWEEVNHRLLFIGLPLFVLDSLARFKGKILKKPKPGGQKPLLNSLLGGRDRFDRPALLLEAFAKLLADRNLYTSRFFLCFMHSFRAFFLKQHYDRRIAEQDKLSKIERLIDWEKFRPLIAKLYHNKSSKGGRPNMDEIVMFKCLVLQSYYNLSDPQLEFQLNDRISFQNFIGLSQPVPDFTTIWRFRERLVKSRVEPLIWEELQRQLVECGIVVKKGVIQDATFIEAPVGRKRKGKGGNHGSEKESPEKSSQLDTDASFSIKRKQIHHGYKLHIKVDVDYGFIRKLATTTAKDHDSRIELSEPEDRRMYRDKGYFGVPLRHPEVEDWTMQRAVRNHSLTAEEKARNRRISYIRSPGERPFAVVKNIFGRGHTRLKRLARVKVQQLFNCFTFNIYHLYHCKRRGRLAADGRASRDHLGCAPEALA